MTKSVTQSLKTVLAITLAIGCSLSSLLSHSAKAKPLRLGCVAGYKKPMMKVLEKFTGQTGIPVGPLFGNMQQVLAQAKASGSIQIVIGDRSFLDASPIPMVLFEPIGKGRLVIAFRKGLTNEKPEDLLS
jgi:molybdate transport system substrate-binding protein